LEGLYSSKPTSFPADEPRGSLWKGGLASFCDPIRPPPHLRPMPGKFPSTDPPVPPSAAGTSGHQDGPDPTQLSGKNGVQTSV